VIFGAGGDHAAVPSHRDAQKRLGPAVIPEFFPGTIQKIDVAILGGNRDARAVSGHRHVIDRSLGRKRPEFLAVAVVGDREIVPPARDEERAVRAGRDAVNHGFGRRRPAAGRRRGERPPSEEGQKNEDDERPSSTPSARERPKSRAAGPGRGGWPADSIGSGRRGARSTLFVCPVHRGSGPRPGWPASSQDERGRRRSISCWRECRGTTCRPTPGSRPGISAGRSRPRNIVGRDRPTRARTAGSR